MDEAKYAIEALDSLIAKYLPSWEGRAAVKAKEVIVAQQSEIDRLKEYERKYKDLCD